MATILSNNNLHNTSHNNSEKIIIYTDGACSGNPGKGGWGAILMINQHFKEISGSQNHTTNNQMELKAVIEALKIIKKSYLIEIYTDSKYVMDGITKWINSWQKNNWLTADKKPVKNIDLWKELASLTKNHQISWHWVRGHSGNKYNEMVDKLARGAINTISTNK